MKKNYKIIFIVIFIFAIAGAAYLLLKRENYRWESEKNRIDFSAAAWNKIVGSRLDGFTPNFGVMERKDTIKDNYKYLRTEGGLLQFGYYLEIAQDTGIKTIDTVEKLKSTFAPVENEAEAVSFVAAVTGGIKTNGDVIAGNSATIKDGYLVEVFRQNDLCGNEQGSDYYKVITSGDVRLVLSKEPAGGRKGCNVRE